MANETRCPWESDGEGRMSAEASELAVDRDWDRWGECPVGACDGHPQWETVTRGGDIERWLGYCGRCHTHITIWND